MPVAFAARSGTRANRSRSAIAHNPHWRRRPSVAAKSAQYFGIDRCVPSEPTVDVVSDAVMSGDLVQQLADRARPETMDGLDLAPAAQRVECVAGHRAAPHAGRRLAFLFRAAGAAAAAVPLTL